MSRPVEVARDEEGGAAVLTISRPERLNALDVATIEALGEAIGAVVSDTAVSGIIVTGAGSRAFVAGADIGELSRLGPAEAKELSRRGQGVFGAIEASPKPVIAAVNGFALGGGCELALACHLRVASASARFGFPEVKLGIIPGYGGTVRLPRLVGSGRALELILTGEPIDAMEAHRIGLVNRVVPDGEALSAARALLAAILRNGPMALAGAIDSIVRGSGLRPEDASEREALTFGRLAGTEDMREGMSAFLEKRPAHFHGR